MRKGTRKHGRVTATKKSRSRIRNREDNLHYYSLGRIPS